MRHETSERVGRSFPWTLPEIGINTRKGPTDGLCTVWKQRETRMNEIQAPAGPALYTVGHSNHSLEEFLNLLDKHRIEVLVDTRSHPYSKYVAHFNREDLQSALRQSGLRYLFLGGELGGRPAEEDYYDDEGHVLYFRV